MISAVVPAKNEAGRAAAVLRNLAQLPIDHIIFIANGCRDATACEALQLGIPKLQFVYFQEQLGIDVPRAVGAKIALSLQSDATLFVDGDMIGTIDEQLLQLVDSIFTQKLDMALTNCYPTLPRHIERCNPTFKWRLALNKALALEQKIQLATPAHGPHAVSKKLLQTLPLHELAIPPVSLALARKNRLKIGIGATIPHHMLCSSVKGQRHGDQIIDTIVGDCLEGIAAYRGETRDRRYQGKTYLGYHGERRFDILDEILTQI